MSRPQNHCLAVLTSHPVQYYGPLFRALAQKVDLHVFFAHKATPEEQARAGFGVSFDWDIDPTYGYAHSFLQNVARRPGTDHFGGCDTPGIGAHLRSGGFDALLVTGWHLKSYVQGIYGAKRAGLPVMVRGDSHLQTLRHPAKRLAKAVSYRALLRVFDAALYVGARNREYYEYYGYPRWQMFHSPHCVDTERFATGATPDAGAALRACLGISPTTRLILFAGKLVDFKRPLDLVDAVAALRSGGMNAEVLVAGSGPLEPALRARATGQAVPIHLLGFQNQSQMPAAYAAANALVLPSTGRETWGLVCNEALACSRPIIVSDACGCMPDLTRGNLAGRHFPLGDVPALSRTIMALLSVPPTPESIRDISNAHSLEAAAAGVQQALRHLRSQRS